MVFRDYLIDPNPIKKKKVKDTLKYIWEDDKKFVTGWALSQQGMMEKVGYYILPLFAFASLFLKEINLNTSTDLARLIYQIKHNNNFPKLSEFPPFLPKEIDF